MPRPPRIQYPGAIYHVINRGNYRSDVFAEVGAAHAFVETMKEAVDRYGWRLGAYVVMRNHYHLSIQTPEPNLSAGMHWLQSTFAIRFNHFHKEQGHIFQGRYHAILLENDNVWSRVNDYIHLNPVRAGIVTAAQMGQFRWSSLANYCKNKRFMGLSAGTWLHALNFSDDVAGWEAYLKHLRKRAGETEAEARSEHKELAKGWAVGEASWKQETMRQHLLDSETGDIPTGTHLPKDMQETRWTIRLEGELKAAGKTREDLTRALKSAAWKVEIAERLQRQFGIPVRWLAEHMEMGKPGSVRAYFWKVRKS